VTPQVVDLSLTKTVNTTSPNVGKPVFYTITVHNDGPNTATNVTVKDVLPPGLLLVSTVTANGSYDFSTGIWTLATPLASGESATLTIRARVTVLAVGGVTNYAQVNSVDQFDIDSTPGNNSITEDDDDQVRVVPQVADLILTKSVNAPTVQIGQNVTYTIRVRNAGPNTATNVSIKDNLAANMFFVSYVATQGTYNSATGVWTVGTVNVGATQTLTLVVRVGGLGLGTRTNVAEVFTSDQFDPNSTPNNRLAGENDQASASILVQAVGGIILGPSKRNFFAR
jgi:uncharacterized repeat protein (TIGR01451 family)